MARRLKLQKFELVHVDYRLLGAWRLRVEATDEDNTGADPYVFLFLRGPTDPYNQGLPRDEWYGTASPVEMAEYPAGEPRIETAFPFFRSNYFEVDLRTVDQAETVWSTIHREVDLLLKALDRLELLVPTASATVGNEGDSSSSSSSSSSAPEGP